MNDAPGTAVALQDFRGDLRKRREFFRTMLPRNVAPEKFENVCWTAAIVMPRLVECDRRSFFLAATRCATDGLLPDGRQAVLLPFRTKVRTKRPDGTYEEQWVDLVQYLPMVAGIRERMRNSGLVDSAEAHVVYRADKFFQKFGTHPTIEHEPPTLGTDRGEAVGAYAVIRLKSGEVIYEVMDKAEIERIRRTSSKAPDSPAWKDHWGEMARKTVLKRAAKAAPSSSEMIELLQRDEEQEEPENLIGADLSGTTIDNGVVEPEPSGMIADQAAAPIYFVVDSDGVEHEFSTPENVEKALRAIFDDAGRRGRAHLEGAAETNREAMRALIKNGFQAVHDALAEHWRELMAELDPFGLKPATTQGPRNDAPDRSPPASDGQQGDARGAPDFWEAWNAIKPPQEGDRRECDEAMGEITNLLAGATAEDLRRPLLTTPLVKALPDRHRARIADTIRRRNAQLQGEAGNG